jgi:glycine/D-amino acid oxidase-like deaminating enzyme
MSLSYWEKNVWFNGLDLVVVGSGLVGLTTALFYKRRAPRSKVLVVERGLLPYGASTRNAGFACYGSPSELLDDLKQHTENEILERVRQRYLGFEKLLGLLGAEKLGYQATGGHELFRTEDAEDRDASMEQISRLNELLGEVFQGPAFIRTRENPNKKWGFKGFTDAIELPHEGQIDTGKCMQSLLQLCQSEGVLILNNIEVRSVVDQGAKAELETNQGIFHTRQVAICTNGFAQQLLKEEVVVPARAQVFISEKISGHPFQGIFHVYKGYYYFRNVGDRLLMGGGRHLFRKEERSVEIQTTAKLQKHLQQFAERHILPDREWIVEDSWAGIMGFGSHNEKGKLVKRIAPKVVCGVRLGGMGIAIGAHTGEQTAKLLLG